MTAFEVLDDKLVAYVHIVLAVLALFAALLLGINALAWLGLVGIAMGLRWGASSASKHVLLRESRQALGRDS
jgi:hypothetical protein